MNRRAWWAMVHGVAKNRTWLSDSARIQPDKFRERWSHHHNLHCKHVHHLWKFPSFLFIYGCCCSVAKLCLSLCNTTDCSTPGFPVLHYLPQFAQTYVHSVGDVIQPPHPLSPPPLPALSLPQDQGLFQWADSLHQVAKVVELQHQHQSSQWIFRVDFL